jgi:hypothetical protein
MSTGADVTSLEEGNGAVKVIRTGPLAESIVWIHAEGMSADALTDLENTHLNLADKALVLIGSNDVSFVTRTLQCLMRARRDNPAFSALVTTTDKESTTQTTCKLMASQSGGWMRFENKDPRQPDRIFQFIERHLALALTPTPLLETNDQDTKSDLDSGVATSLQDAVSAANEALIDPPADPSPIFNPPPQGVQPMATLNDSMNACMQIDGAMAAALVDMGSGMALAKVGGGVNLDIAAAGNTEVLKAKLKTMAGLGLKDVIEDVLITLGTQYHLIRPVPHKQGLFLYLVLDKTKGNLAMARFKLMEIERSITV